jgi:hypothetical protein
MIALEMQKELLEELASEKKEPVNKSKKVKPAKKQKEPPKMGKTPVKKQLPPQPTQTAPPQESKKKRKNKNERKDLEEDDELAFFENDEDWNVVQKNKKSEKRSTTSVTISSAVNTNQERRSSSTSPPLVHHVNTHKPVQPSPVQTQSKSRENVQTVVKPQQVTGWSNVVVKDVTEKQPVVAPNKPKLVPAQSYEVPHTRVPSVGNTDVWTPPVLPTRPIQPMCEYNYNMDHLLKNIVDDNDDDIPNHFSSADYQFSFRGDPFGSMEQNQYRPERIDPFVPVIGYEMFGIPTPVIPQNPPSTVSSMSFARENSQEEETYSPSDAQNHSNPFHLPSVTSQVFGFGSIL